MNSKQNPFVQSFIYAFVLAAFIAVVSLTQFNSWLHPWVWLIFIFLFTLSLATTGIIYMLYHHNPKRFRTNYLLIITIRSLIAMLILAYAVYMQVSDLKNFAINYFIIYLVFVIFEIFTLRTNTNRNLR